MTEIMSTADLKSLLETAFSSLCWIVLVKYVADTHDLYIVFKHFDLFRAVGRYLYSNVLFKCLLSILSMDYCTYSM